MEPTPILEVAGAVVDHGGVHAVRGIDLAVAPGESVAVLGANGAGKTSLLTAISGLVPLAGGVVRVDGEDVTGFAPEEIARRGVAHVPDDRGIFDELTVADNLRVAAYGAGLDRAAFAESRDEVLDLFPVLAERRGQVAGTMSGGQQQMLTLARALLQRPRLLMVDEMSMGLAPSIVAELFEVVGALTGRGIGVLLVEQFVGQALAAVDRAVVVAGGRVVARGTAAEVADDDIAAHYLGGAGDDRDRGPLATVLPASEEVGVPLDARQLRALRVLADREGRPVADVLAELVRPALADGRHAPGADDEEEVA